MIPLRYKQEPSTQAAARLLARHGSRMSFLKLLKLLYLADRKALIELGRPISYDRYVSMPHGPVLSQTYNLIVGEEPLASPSYWRQYISVPENFEVSLIKEAPNDQLSPAQEVILDQVFDEFGAMDRWSLRDYTHTLPEWHDPQGSSVPISIREVLEGAGLEEEDIDAIEQTLLADDALLNPA